MLESANYSRCNDMPALEGSRGSVRFEGFELDLHAGELHPPDGTNGRKTVRLSEQPLLILTMLLERPGQVVTREEIRKRLWPNDTIVEFEHRISAAMNRLRQALGDTAENPRFIETLARRGYRFICPVEAGAGLVSTRPNEQAHAQAGLARRWPVRLAAMLALLALGAAVAPFVRRLTETQTELKQQQLTINPGDDPVTSGAISPDGKYLAYADFEGIHIRLIQTGESQTILQPEALKGGSVRWRVGPWFHDSTRFLANASSPEKHELVPWFSYPKVDHPSIWTISTVGRTARKLRDHAFAWSVSPDDTSVVFTTRPGRIGDREVWLMSPDGTQSRRLFETDENSDFRNVQWSPDGLRIGYIKRHLLAADVEVSIETRDSGGGAPRTILSDPGLHGFSWLPDSRVILISGKQNLSGATCNLWEVRIDASTGKPREKPRRLTNWAGFCMDTTSVTADGKQLAFKKWAGQESVYVADLESNETRIANPRRLPLSEGVYVPTAWTADSAAVVFDSHRNGEWGIFKQPLDQRAAQLIANGTEADEDFKCPRVSPDGAWVIYQDHPREPSTKLVSTATIGRFTQLMRAPITGGAQQPVTTASLIDCVRCAKSPSGFCAIGEPSPDGRQVIFTELDPVKGRGRQLARFDVNDPTDRYGFDVSPEGSRIAVLKFQTGSVHILSLTGQQTLEFTVGNWMNGLDWAADGKGLFVSTSTGLGAALVHVDLGGNAVALWEQPGEIVGTYGLPSPDGRHLLMYRSSINSNIWMLEGF
jgi:eukaryotic-like serine/threonine-protein kinase